MSELHLLLSNPPHAAQVDAAAAALCLGLTESDLRPRLREPAPEIWSVETDTAELTRKVEVLAGAGVQAVATRGELAARVPAGRVAKGFQFATGAVEWETSAGNLSMPYATRLLVVTCEPKPEPVSARGGSTRAKSFTEHYKAGGQKRLGMLLGPVGAAMAADLELMEDRRADKLKVSGGGAPASSPARMDVYTFLEGVPHRVSLVQGQTRFQGLGRDMGASFRANVGILARKLNEQFRRVDEDRRLVNVTLSEHIIAGRAYRALWKEISPSLAGADRFDLASRLVFLTYCSG
jgi:hypothetical protein